MKHSHRFVNLPKLVRRVWLILWAILGILLILKYCFNIWYPIAVNNEIINSVFLFLDQHLIIRNIIYYTLYIISSNLLFLTCIKKLKYDKILYMIIFSLISLGVVLLKNINNVIGLFCEILIIIIAISYNIKKKTYKNKFWDIAIPIIIYILLNVWQFNIYLIRDLDIELLKNLPSMVSLILMLDYYIFLIITWIGVKYMSILSWGWLFGKELTELEAIKAEELSKKNPDQELINKIDEVIAVKEK